MTAKLLALLAVLAVASASCGDDAPVTSAGTPSNGGDRPSADLTIVVTGGEFSDLTYRIRCGDQPSIEPVVTGVEAAGACERLADREVVQRLVEGPPADRICTEIYGGPQEATITGTLAGQPVDARVTRNNGCEIDTWDRMLAGVLPATIGVGDG